MSDGLMIAMTAFAERLVTLAAHDDGLREDMRSLAEVFLWATERPPIGSTQDPHRQLAEGAELALLTFETSQPLVEAPIVSTVAETIGTPSPLPELTLGRARPAEAHVYVEPPALSSKAASTDAELPAIEARCRLKAEAVRWAAIRRRRMDQGAEFRVDISPTDRDMHDRGKALECYLWMSIPDFTVPREPALMEDLAGCFDAVADALSLLSAMSPDFEANREFFEPALDVLAEAQSALGVAIERINGPSDPDQFRVYDWLRGVAAREQIFIRRHMRLDDPADPSQLPGIDGRIEALDTRIQEVRHRAKKRKSALTRLRYHAKQIAEGSMDDHHWRKVAGATDEMIQEGVPASKVEIREALLPILDEMPDLDEVPTGFVAVLREIDRYLAGRMPVAEVTAPDQPSPQVIEAARLLSGKGMVLIGGSRRPGSYEALKNALGLKELVWLETREHESIDRFEAYVARPEIVVVLLAIRWSSHSFGDVKEFCDRYGKPMVRLPGGYNPNQVATQIIAQCSGHLEAD